MEGAPHENKMAGKGQFPMVIGRIFFNMGASKITRPTGIRVHYEVRRTPMTREFVLKTNVWVRVYS
jgi:hypothetical protein